LEYVKHKAAAWEHLAYLKAYPVGGEKEFAEAVYQDLQAHILQAHDSHSVELAREVRRMRERLEKEKARNPAQHNIKYGPGGMLDVYFATRYLQLKHQIHDPPERGTLQLIDHLLTCGVLEARQRQALFEGYAFLRRTDHGLRLLFERPRAVAPANRDQLRLLARLLGFESVEEWEQAHRSHTTLIRQVYDHIVRPDV
jgi:[glutamine synthetase] adenylyltransferase / [glutamine synthetase]-adenylyl-L-tyrosine phosphorylase